MVDDGDGGHRSSVGLARTRSPVVHVSLDATTQAHAVGFDVAEEFRRRFVVAVAVAEVVGRERRLTVLALDRERAVLRAQRAPHLVDRRL